MHPDPRVSSAAISDAVHSRAPTAAHAPAASVNVASLRHLSPPPPGSIDWAHTAMLPYLPGHPSAAQLSADVAGNPAFVVTAATGVRTNGACVW